MPPFGALLAQSEPGGFVLWIDRLARAPLSIVLLFVLSLTLVRVAVYPYLKSVEPDDRGSLYSFARIVNEVCDAVCYAGVVVFMLVRPFGIQTFFIPSGSMIDTLNLYDYIVANKLVYRVQEPRHGDIVVFKPPKRALGHDQEDTDFIKRLIGLPGDVIEWKGKKLVRNGRVVDEPYVDYTVDPNGPVAPKDEWETVMQADFKLVLDGDRVVPVQYSPSTVNMFPLDDQVIDGLTTCAPEYIPNDLRQAKAWRDAPAVAVPPGYLLFMGDNRNGSYDCRGWGLVPRASVIGKSEAIFFPLNRWRWTR
ncbi:MAG: signal peptidase I [Armatimonadetes bacterium]|nr:signal peptidase I [Armatimonadota bacterium]